MKKLFTLSVAVAFLTLSQFTFADQSERAVNPGEDPNLEMTSQGADVAAQGTGCRECLARLKGGRLQDATTAKSRGSEGSSSSSKSNSGVE